MNLKNANKDEVDVIYNSQKVSNSHNSCNQAVQITGLLLLKS